MRSRKGKRPYRVTTLTKKPRVERGGLTASKLQPGDLVSSRWREGRGGVVKHLSDKIVSTFTGSPYTHTGIYAGKGRVIDYVANTRGSGFIVVDRPLKTMLKDNKIRIDRPMLSASERRQAVERARGHVGKRLSAARGRFNAVASEFPILRLGTGPKKGLRDRDMMCANMVASAYGGKLNKKKVVNTQPGDLIRSRKTRFVTKMAANEAALNYVQYQNPQTGKSPTEAVLQSYVDRFKKKPQPAIVGGDPSIPRNPEYLQTKVKEKSGPLDGKTTPFSDLIYGRRLPARMKA